MAVFAGGKKPASPFVSGQGQPAPPDYRRGSHTPGVRERSRGRREASQTGPCRPACLCAAAAAAAPSPVPPHRIQAHPSLQCAKPRRQGPANWPRPGRRCAAAARTGPSLCKRAPRRRRGHRLLAAAVRLLDSPKARAGRGSHLLRSLRGNPAPSRSPQRSSEGECRPRSCSGDAGTRLPAPRRAAPSSLWAREGGRARVTSRTGRARGTPGSPPWRRAPPRQPSRPPRCASPAGANLTRGRPARSRPFYS